nr:condensation domain-containing protein [Streptomyces inhibens]
MTHALRLSSSLDLRALQAALDLTFARHAALRSRFGADRDGSPVRWTVDDSHVRITVRPMRGADENDIEGAIGDFAWTPMNLDTGPLVRALLLRNADEEHVCALSVHHTVFDDWSTDILLADLATAYGASAAGEDRPPPCHRPPGAGVRGRERRSQGQGTPAVLLAQLA